ERGAAGLQPRLDPWLGGLFRVDARSLQLEQPARRGARQLGLAPDSGGEAEHGRLIRLQPDLGQLVGLARDPVADLLIAAGVGTCLERDAELAQFVLVPLEHPLERVEGGWISGYRIADLARCQVPARGQQAYHQAEQTLGFMPR